MRYFFLCLLALLIFPGYVVAQPDSLLHTTYAKRHSYVFELRKCISSHKNPAFALDSLQGLVEHAKRAGAESFAYQLSFVRILDVYLKKPGTFKEISTEIEEAEQKGYLYEATDAKTRLAKHLWDIGERTRALELALNAYDVYRDMSVEDFPERIEAQRSLANCYYHFEDYSKAKALMLELADVTPAKLIKEYGSATVTLALAYRQLGDYDSALYYFKQVYNNTDITTPNQGLAAGNIGSIYYLRKDYDNAIFWVKRELQIWKQLSNNSNLSSFSAYAWIAKSYLNKGNVAWAQTYLDSATRLRYKVRKSFKELMLYHMAQSAVQEASGHYVAALRNMDTLRMYTDSVNIATNSTQMVKAEKRIADAEHKAELLYLDNLRQKSLWIRNFVILAILMLAMITLLLINRSRLRHKQKELNATNEKNKAENKLLLFTKQFQEKNRQIDDLKEELKHVSDEQDVADKNDTIARLQQATILTDDQWDEFRILFEKVHSGYINKVKEKFPGLTPAELRYLTLLKLNLHNKEMANILGVSMNTVHNYKSRLRRKYSIADEIQLEDMIKDI